MIKLDSSSELPFVRKITQHTQLIFVRYFDYQNDKDIENHLIQMTLRNITLKKLDDDFDLKGIDCQKKNITFVICSTNVPK